MKISRLTSRKTRYLDAAVDLGTDADPISTSFRGIDPPRIVATGLCRYVNKRFFASLDCLATAAVLLGLSVAVPIALFSNAYAAIMSIVLVALLTSVSMRLMGMHERLSILDLRTAAVNALISASLAVATWYALIVAGGAAGEIPAAWLGMALVAIVASALAVRGALYLFFESDLRAAVAARRVALLGAGAEANAVLEHLTSHQHRHYTVIGVFDDRDTRVTSELHRGKQGNFEELERLIRARAVDDVFICLPLAAEQRVTHFVERLADMPVDSYVASRLFGSRVPFLSACHIPNGVVLKVAEHPLTGWSGVAKWFEDKVLATALLVVLSPLLMLIAIAVKLDSKGPVLFSQKRYGLYGQLITVSKFRSMYTDCTDHNADRLVERDDARVTRVGKLLRRTSLDELPQLINVLKGEMSIVGPRPHATLAKANGRLYHEVVARYQARHKVKPGITGWAQVNGWRGETDTEEKIVKRVEHDLFYIQNWSLSLDLYILWRTATALTDKNAF